MEQPDQNPTPAAGASPRARLDSEDLVIVAVIALGFVGSLVIYTLRWPIPPLVVAMLLSAAVSALVYRFLGGISEDTTLTVGALKLSGVLAALIGCGMLFAEHLPKPHTLETLFDPPRHEWVAFDKASLIPIDVRVVGIEETIPADHEFTQQKPLYVHKDSTRAFTVSPDERGDFALGTLDADMLKAQGFTAKLEQFKHTRKLEAGEIHTIDSWGLRLKASQYGNDESGFTLYSGTDTTGPHFLETRQTRTVALDGAFYLVYVLEANHGAAPPWAKFGIAKIQIELE